MKNLLLILTLMLPFGLFSQDADPPGLYEVYHMKAIDGHENDLEAAIKAHNAEFHGEGIFHAELFYNVNGPFAGMYSWIMGPTSYTALDDRPGKGAHDEDWKKVTAHVDGSDGPSYWSMNYKLSQIKSTETSDKSLLWMYDIKGGQMARWSELIGKVKEVYEKKRPTESILIVSNEFVDTKAGMDAVVVFPFEKWSWLDRKSEFAKQFEEVHGPGTFHHFLNGFSDVVDGRVDWLRTTVK